MPGIMESDGVAKSIARWVALGALFLLPLTPLIVANTLFFPFITGKGLYLRIVIECAFVAWVVLALLDRAYRPRFSWIGATVVAFVGWMLIADAFAPNALKAFWSNYERMEGWVLLVHLSGLFFAASNVLRVEKKWRAWFLTWLVVSLYIVGYAILQLTHRADIHQGSTRIDASLGNSAYLAIYLFFNVCVASWLALTERFVWLKWSLLTLAVVEGILIFFTETRGTVIALAVALALASLLTLLTAGKRARTAATVGLILILVGAGGLYLARDSAFVENNSTLRRVTSISLADGQTRFTLWHMALQGTLDRPLVGWGQEGYNYIFNQYYDPSLYEQEPWFDRAHNTFIDWLVAGGFPAFFLYIGLFGTALYFLWRNSTLSRAERIALTAALVGYAIHNFFVFDNLTSYLYFFAVLALIDSQIARPLARVEAVPEVDALDGVTYVLPVAAVSLFVLIWLVNIPGLQVAGKLITALSSQQFDTTLATFQDLAAHPGFAAQEVREQIVSFAGSVSQSSSIPTEQKRQAAILAVTEMQKQVAAYPRDAREHLELAYIYRAYGGSAEALKEMEIARQLSPAKPSILIEMGITSWDAGDVQAANDYFTKAYALAPQFRELAIYGATGQFALGNTKEGDAILQKMFGTTVVDSNILATAYYRTKNWPRLIALWEARSKSPTATPQTWFALAAAYYAAGDVSRALELLQHVAKQYPDAAASVQSVIDQIKSGK